MLILDRCYIHTFPIIHCLRKNQFCKVDSFVHLLESLRLIPRAIKVLSIWFSHNFTAKLYKHVVLWWKEHISQSKFKDDIESLNTDDVLSVILMIERENGTCIKHNYNLKFDVFSNTFYLRIGILKTCIHHTKMKFFLRKSKSEEETIWSF